MQKQRTDTVVFRSAQQMAAEQAAAALASAEIVIPTSDANNTSLPSYNTNDDYG